MSRPLTAEHAEKSFLRCSRLVHAEGEGRRVGFRGQTVLPHATYHSLHLRQIDRAEVCMLELIPMVETLQVLERCSPAPPYSGPADLLTALVELDAHCDDRGMRRFEHPLPGSDLSPIEALDDAQLRALVLAHIIDSDNDCFRAADELIALWGGFWLQQDEQTLHLPHCCGSIGDIHAWVALLDPTQRAGGMAEGHPGLRWRRVADGLIQFEQGEEYDPAPAGLPHTFSLPMTDLDPAIRNALRIMLELDQRIAGLHLSTPCGDVANGVVWTSDPGEGSRERVQSTMQELRIHA